MTAVGEVLSGLHDELGGLVDLYRDLHRSPELSMQEHRTADLVERRLTDLGYQVQRVGGTGVVGVLANGPGATVLARADIDALPVREATGLDYASTVTVDGDGGPVPVMHACGHDMHATALMGAAQLMAAARSARSGTYIALFQPGEEIGAGAQAMLDDGLVARTPRPDVALGQQVLPFEAGTIGTTPGPVLSAGDSVRVTVHGKGAHGSLPHNSIDPVVLAAGIVLRLQTIVSRETPPGQFAVVTVGAVNAGTAANIIPDRATLLLNVRTYDPALRLRVIASIERMVRGECAASGSPRDPEFEYYDQVPLTSNDDATTERVTRAFVAHFGADLVHHQDPVTASEDFSRLPDAFGIPYSYWTVGGHDAAHYRAAVAAGRVAQDVPANHSPLFYPVIDPTLATMVQTQVVAALAWLGA